MPIVVFKAIQRLRLSNFTAFDDLWLDFSEGVNVLVGTNGTGKTHVLKVLHAALDVTRTGQSFADKLVRTFQPFGDRLGRLARRKTGSITAQIVVARGVALRLKFSNRTAPLESAQAWKASRVESVFIPVKEMLAHSPGFLSLYRDREIHFDETYADIIQSALKPPLKGKPDPARARLLALLEKHISGSVETRNEHFFLRSRQGNLEFGLLAEGLRKLALLWVLIRNGTLTKGSVLLWDEPEANLNPEKMKSVVSLLLALRRMGVQIFLATHDYALLKEFDLQAAPDDEVVYHVLYRESDDGPVEVNTVKRYSEIRPSKINDAFDDMLDRQLRRSLGREVAS